MISSVNHTERKTPRTFGRKITIRNKVIPVIVRDSGTIPFISSECSEKFWKRFWKGSVCCWHVFEYSGERRGAIRRESKLELPSSGYLRAQQQIHFLPSIRVLELENVLLLWEGRNLIKSIDYVDVCGNCLIEEKEGEIFILIPAALIQFIRVLRNVLRNVCVWNYSWKKGIRTKVSGTGKKMGIAFRFYFRTIQNNSFPLGSIIFRVLNRVLEIKTRDGERKKVSHVFQESFTEPDIMFFDRSSCDHGWNLTRRRVLEVF